MAFNSAALAINKPIKAKAVHASAGMYNPNSKVCCRAHPSNPSQMANQVQLVRCKALAEGMDAALVGLA